MTGGRSTAERTAAWEQLPWSELLEVRICDLGLRLESSPLAGRMEELDGEFERAGLRFRPYAWLSTDWFTPDGTTGFGVPFWLAHPRLLQLERREMLEVEGGTHASCMQLLRHEAAHAIDNAYRLRRRRSWREVFGPVSRPYRAYYRARPSSRDFVQNLDSFYSQSHPLDDFAETFAVWLQADGRWRRRYRDWPALRKLEFVDELMEEIADEPPLLRTQSRVDSLPTLRATLGTFYRRRHARGDDVPAYVDGALKRLFPARPDGPVGGGGERYESASAWLRRNRSELCRRVASVRGEDPYVVEQVVKVAVRRARALDLGRWRADREVRRDAPIVVGMLAAQLLDRGSPLFWR